MNEGQFTGGLPRKSTEPTDQMELNFKDEPEKPIDFQKDYTSQQRMELTASVRQKQHEGIPLNKIETAFEKWSKTFSDPDDSAKKRRWWN